MSIVLPSPDLDELQLRDFELPKIENSADLSAVISALVDRPHDYGTAVYAVAWAAVAAFNYAAHKLGITGFQAGCADMSVLRRTRHLTGPFMLVDGENALYPQYDLREKLEEFLSEIGAYLGDEARKRLADTPFAHPNVIAHWEALAAKYPAREGSEG